MDNNILVQNLCKQFEDFSLDNVSFKVPKGRIVGFIGENGAGKSTTINLILNELTSQQFFLYNSITFISISIASIPVPATHIPTTNIRNNQYTIPAIKGFGIFVLICATDCPASIVQPIKVCRNDAASWKNDLQSERNTSDCTA